MVNETRTLSYAKQTLLDGRRFPNGRPISFVDNTKKVSIAAPIVIETYGALKTYDDLMKDVYRLARILDKSFEDGFFVIEGGRLEYKQYQQQKIHDIAQEGRRFYLETPRTIEERVAEARLFQAAPEQVFSAQVADPDRGCSASVCTNCYESIAFCDYTCEVCNYDLIGVSNMPDLDEWEQMPVQERKRLLSECFSGMMESISRSGDWRGNHSPFNTRAGYKGPHRGLVKS